MKLTWTRRAPGIYRTTDGRWRVERTTRGNGYGGKSWHLLGPDPITGAEGYYCTPPTKAEAQFVAQKEEDKLAQA